LIYSIVFIIVFIDYMIIVFNYISFVSKLWVIYCLFIIVLLTFHQLITLYPNFHNIHIITDQLIHIQHS